MSISKETALAVAAILSDISEGIPPKRVSIGLCSNIEFEINKGISASSVLSSIMRQYGIDYADWDYYSGDPYYPVPDPLCVKGDYSMDARIAAQEVYRTAYNMYDGEYGELRNNLAGWLAARIRQAIENEA